MEVTRETRRHEIKTRLGIPALVFLACLWTALVFVAGLVSALVVGSKMSSSETRTNGIGTQGPVGPIGLTGLRGPEGPLGVQGLRGPKGEQGPKGLGGYQGKDGATGKDGKTGPRGKAGPEGKSGKMVGKDEMKKAVKSIMDEIDGQSKGRLLPPPRSP